MNKNFSESMKSSNLRSTKLFRSGLIILIIILAINILSLALKLGQSSYYSGGSEYSDLEYYLEQKDYPTLVRQVTINEALNFKSKKDTTSFVYFSDFYQAAFLYKAYKDAGQDEKAQASLAEVRENLKAITDAKFDDAIKDVEELYDINI